MILESAPASVPSARTSLSSIPSPSRPSRASIAVTTRAVVRCSDSTSAARSGGGLSSRLLARIRAASSPLRGFHPIRAALPWIVIRCSPCRRAMSSTRSSLSS